MGRNENQTDIEKISVLSDHENLRNKMIANAFLDHLDILIFDKPDGKFKLEKLFVLKKT